MLQYLYLQANNVADMNKSVIEKFLQYMLIVRGYPRNTVLAYQNDLVQLEVFCSPEGGDGSGDWWKRLNKTKIKLYNIHLRKKEYLPATINRKIASMKSFLMFLNDQDLITTNPAQNIKLDKATSKRAPEYLTIEEIIRILQACSDDDFIQIRNKAMVGLLYSSGLRVSELVSLNVIDTNIQDEWIRVDGKGSKERFVPVHSQAWENLKLYMYQARPALKTKFTGDSLFVNARGKRMTRQGFWSVLKELTYKAGITKSVSPHMIRHTFATHLLQGGSDLVKVKNLLGHSSIATTKIYTHLTSQYVRDNFNKTSKGPAR